MYLLFSRTKAQSPFPAGRLDSYTVDTIVRVATRGRGAGAAGAERYAIEFDSGRYVGDNTTMPDAHTARLPPRASRAYVSPDPESNPERQLQNGAPTYPLSLT